MLLQWEEMENREWEETLKDILGNYTPEEMHPDWTAFSDYQHEHEYLEEITKDADFDEGIREPLSSFESADQKSAGWERIESSLDTDTHFDENVRHRIQDFQTQYDPHTWTKLVSRISGVGYLRTKLIAFKVVEVTAVLLLLFTVLKMSHMGKLPFDNDKQEQQENQQQTGPSNGGNDRADADPDNAGTKIDDASLAANTNSEVENFDVSSKRNLSIGSGQSTSNFSISKNIIKNSDPVSPATPVTENLAAKKSFAAATEGDAMAYGTGGSDDVKAEAAQNRSLANSNHAPELQSISGVIAPVASSSIAAQEAEINAITDVVPGVPSILKYDDTGRHDVASADFLAPSFRPLSWSKDNLPEPKFVKQRPRRFTEFGVIAQMDYNRLRMPEDKLYSAGRQIIFPQQGIPSTSMGGGFTIGIGHPKWTIETGIIYSSKTFLPGRQLIVGGAFDNGIVEFQAMRLQLLTVPLQYRYRIAHKGPLKFYALGGFGVNVIAQSNIDVVVKYHFPSLSFGENPNNNPVLAQTIRETKRVREHIRDGAPLSTKNFVTANLGGGVEYAVLGDKILFLQTAVQYQVPKIAFSNNNGKHIRSVTLQAGIRTPLGK